MENNTHDSNYKGLDNTSLNKPPEIKPSSTKYSIHPNMDPVREPETQESISKMTSPQYFAVIAGSLMLALAVISLIAPGIINDNLPTLLVNSSYGWFMDFLPMNIMNKMALFLFGVAGISVMNDTTSSVVWARVVFVSMGLLAIMGLFSATNTFFGVMPLFSSQVPTYALFSILGLYFSVTGMKYIRYTKKV